MRVRPDMHAQAAALRQVRHSASLIAVFGVPRLARWCTHYWINCGCFSCRLSRCPSSIMRPHRGIVGVAHPTCAATCTCSAGYANILTGQSTCGTNVAPCNQCAQGTYCLGNAAQPAACIIGSVPAGSYCPAGTTTSSGTTCPAGSSCAGAAADAGTLECA